MDAVQWSTSVHALAVSIARSMDTDDLTRVALLFTQLGTTLATIAALQGLDEGDASEAADLSGLT